MQREVIRRAGLAALVSTLALAGCSRGSGQASGGDGGGSGQGGAAYAADRGGRSGGYGDETRADRGPVPLFHGEPMWSENRSHSAKENAEYHFQRAGSDLQAKTLDDFLSKVHRFGDHPPAGTLKLTRPNGDKLLYDPKANLFAVFTREGAPRTVFKPNDGMAYWTEQKERAAHGDDGYRRRSYAGGYGGGSEGARRGEGGGSDQGE